MIAVDVTLDRGRFNLHAQFAAGAGITGVFGPSGAGKSTLLHLLCGLLRPTRGRIAIGETVVVDTAARVFVPTHRRRVAVVFQDGRLLPHRSVTGNLRYGERLLSAAERRIAFTDVVELLRLAPLLTQPVAKLSGGERQRVALGRALLSAPRLLCLDEPLSAVDHDLRDGILPYLRLVQNALKIPMLYVSHDLSEVLALTDRMVLLNAGRVAGAGALIELAAQPALVPMLHALGLVNVLAADAQDDALTLSDSVVLHGPAGGAQGRVTVLIAPQEVALATAPVAGVSIRNQVPGCISAITATRERTLVTVDIGVPLLAEVSSEAVTRLGLACGQLVWCLVKAQALRVLGT